MADNVPRNGANPSPAPIEEHHPAPSAAATRYPQWPFHPLVVLLRRFVHFVVFFPFLRWLNPLYVHGRENIESLSGPFIFVANHASHADTPALMRAMPAKIRRRMTAAAAADYFFTSWIRGYVACFICNAFPFPRKGREGIERAIWLLNHGWHIMLFPEGTRSLDGNIKPFKPGVGKLAAESGATVIPVALLGTVRVFPKGAPLPRRASVEVRIGPAMHFSPDEDPVEITRQIEDVVRELASPEGIDLVRGQVRKR